MSSNTTNLNLYKANPTTDGENTFNIDTLLNENWDKIDANVAKKSEIPTIPTSLPANGGNSTTVNNHTAATTANTAEKIDLIGMTNEIKNEIDTHKADNVYQLAGGTATAITLTISGNLVSGYPINFIAKYTDSNTSKTINGKKFYKPGTTTSPSTTVGKAYTAWYDSTGDSNNGCFFIKASAEGDAVVGDVLAGKIFSNGNDTGLVGTLALTGTTGVGDVVNGKTFYNTDAKTIQTGTGANAKRWASSITTSDASSMLTVSGLTFTPSVIVFCRNTTIQPSGTYMGKKDALNYSVSNSIFAVSNGGGYVQNGGFKLNCTNANTSMYWEAYE